MPQTAIALSGGIDSLTAAWLLKKNGHSLLGIHFKTGYEELNPKQVTQISNQLDIPVKIIDCSGEFEKLVVDYFVNTYKTGKTPNPCLVCNPAIKFGTILDFARNMNADSIATGHYARVKKDSNGLYHLYKGKDLQKDQSYFLAFMSQKQLASAGFPLGKLTKPEVRKIAEQAGLSPTVKKESQDICFIKGSYKDFLLNHGNIEQKPGIIEDIKGKAVGRHNGLHLFTIGQRRGINCPASEPYYVVNLDVKSNRLVVGFKDDLLASQCMVKDINWIVPPEKIPVKVHVRLRYRHKAALAAVIHKNSHTVTVEFDSPQSAITPGQGAVFYNDDEVLGGGWIC